jgi:hypothetical protein
MSRYYRSILNVQGGAPAFIPTDIAGCQLWLDAADATTISIGTGVSQWNDKSGQGNNAIQAVAASQPAYVIGGKNGLNTLAFDGSDDGMEGAWETLNQMTLFVVVDNNSGTFGRVFSHVEVGQSDDFTAGTIPILRSSPTALASYSSVIANFFNNTTYSNNYAIIVYERGALNTNLTVEATTSSTANLAIGTIDRYRIGFNAPFSGAMFGEIAEIIAYDSILSTDNKTAVETYLSNKWAI